MSPTRCGGARRIPDRASEEKNRPVHQVLQYPYTVEGQKEYILNELTRKTSLSFIDMIHSNPTRVALIFNFLAILEMLALGNLDLQMGEGYNNFWISLKEAARLPDQQVESGS